MGGTIRMPTLRDRHNACRFEGASKSNRIESTHPIGRSPLHPSRSQHLSGENIPIAASEDGHGSLPVWIAFQVVTLKPVLKALLTSKEVAANASLQDTSKTAPTMTGAEALGWRLESLTKVGLLPPSSPVCRGPQRCARNRDASLDPDASICP